MTILRPDHHGAEVALLQRRLTRSGFAVAETHVFDTETGAAVRQFQQVNGLVTDGLVGPQTQHALMGLDDPRRLSDADLLKAAKTLGVPVPVIRAVNQVESRGQGFLSDGRPVILFERHVFYERLRAMNIDPDSLAADCPNIASKTPGGYLGGAAEYVRLTSAERIDVAAAHESASWGAFQVMGYHWKALGYASVADFVERMRRHEADHLDAFVRFVAADTTLLRALVTRKWAAFARGYNGPAYARNLYDVKLARAYERYATQNEALV
jgi:hypothetical protein